MAEDGSRPKTGDCAPRRVVSDTEPELISITGASEGIAASLEGAGLSAEAVP